MAYELPIKEFLMCTPEQISPQIQASSSLLPEQENQQRFRVTFEQAAVGMAHVAPDGKFMQVNQKFCELLGYSQTELLVLTFQDITYADDLAMDLAYVHQLLSGERAMYTMEKRYIRRDGLLLWANLTVSLVRDTQGILAYFIAVIEDIDARKQLEEALRRSEERLRIGLQGTSVTIYQQDRDLYYNWIYNPLSTFSPESIVGKTDADFVLPEEARQLTQIKQQVMRTGKGLRIELKTTSIAGAHVHDLTVEPLRDSTGMIVGVTGTSLDVTERKQTEASLRQRDDFLRDVLDSIFAFVGVMTPGGILTEINRTALHSAHLRLEEVLGKPFEETYWWSYDTEIQKQLRASIGRAAQGETVRYDVTVRLGEQSFAMIDFAIVPITNRERQVQYLIPSGIEITERKQTEEQLRKSEAKARQLIDSNIIGVIIADMDVVLEANDAFLELVGYSREDLEARRIDWSKMAPLEQVSPLGQSLQELRERGICTPFEKDYVRRDGSHIVVLVGAAVVQEEPLQWACFILNITERKELELRKDTFLSMAGHELRSPITAIKGNLQLAERYLKKVSLYEDKLPQDAKKNLLEIANRISRALRQVAVQTRLINDLLDVSRITANKLDLSFDLYDLAAIVQEIVDDQRATMPNRSITLDVQVAEPLLVMADRDRIGQVVSNYLINALKYSGEEINVGVVREDNVARVCVKDHGPGLTKQQQQQLWERFYQVPGIAVQSGSGAGLGLGLYICQMLIARHDGHVGVDSIPGQGSTFWFTIPLVQ
jgi:PAS domain S-box-containing protein